jgi:hypothetical protein
MAYWLPRRRARPLSLSDALAIIALLVQNAHAAIPMGSGHAFEAILLALLVFLAGNLLRGM